MFFVYVLLLLAQLAEAAPLIKTVGASTYMFLIGTGTCNTQCAAASLLGAGACVSSPLVINTTYLSTIQTLANNSLITYSGTNTGGGLIAVPYVNGNALLGAPMQCTAASAICTAYTQLPQYSSQGGLIGWANGACSTSVTVRQICACQFSAGLNTTQLSSNVSSVFFSQMATLANTSVELNNYPFGNNNPQATITSTAMDPNNNIYYTISTTTNTVVSAGIYTATVPLPTNFGYLFVLYAANGYSGRPQYTGVSTCASVFNNATNVFCLGSAGLIKVV